MLHKKSGTNLSSKAWVYPLKSLKQTGLLSKGTHLILHVFLSVRTIFIKIRTMKNSELLQHNDKTIFFFFVWKSHSLSTSSRTLQTFTQQETITPCLLFILQSIYLHNLSPRMSSQPITSRTYQRLLYLLTNEIAHQGFWIFNWLTLPLDSEDGFRTGCRNVSH